MVLLAINTTIVTTGIVVFLIVILILVGILLFAKAKLTAKGDVKISINNGDRIITTEPGSSLLSTLAGQKIFLPSACGGKGSCGMCKCQVDSGAGSILPTETGFFSYKQQHENWRLACQVKVKENIEMRIPESVMGIKKWECTVVSNRNISTFLKEFVVKLPEGENLKFKSGGYIQIDVPALDVDFKDMIIDEKYKGDLLLGKTFTVDPISKRRLENFGEEDKFYIQNHHEPIVSEEVFEEAQKILAKRNVNRGVHQDGQKRNKFSRKYAFSCMIKCGFCGGTLTRRNWHSSSAYTKTIWQCVTATKQGKKYCPHCKGIPEEVIEKAFVKSYQLLCSDQQQVVEEFLQKVEGVLNEDTSLKRLPKIEKEMNDLRKRKEKLLDLRLDTTIDRDIYESKNRELSEQLKKLQEEQEQLLELSKNRENTRTRLREFRKNLSSGEILEDFDRVVFESVVEKIIIGGYNKEGVEEPLKITFVYKTGIHSNFNGKDFKPKRRNAAALHSDAELCSYASDEAAELCSHSSNDTLRSRVNGCGNPSPLFNSLSYINL